MGRRCTVCEHPRRAEIELATARGVSARQISQRVGSVSLDAILRHKKDHMEERLTVALKALGRPSCIDLDALRESESQGLLVTLTHQRARIYTLLDEAERLGDLAAAARIHGRILESLKLGAALVGEIATASQHVTNNLIVTPQYLELRGALTKALKPHPEASRAVAAALRAIEAPGETHRPSPGPIFEHEAPNAGP